LKIAILASAANNHTVRWAEFLARCAHEVLLLSDTSPRAPIRGVRVEHPEMSIATKILAYKITDHRVGNNRFKHRAYVPRILAFQPNFVIAMEALGYGPIIPHVENIPRVLMPWGSDMLVWPKDDPTLRELVESAVAAADALTANAPGMEQSLFEFIEARPSCMKLFPWGCDTRMFCTGDRAEARAALNIEPTSRIVLSPRNATEHLGAHFIVEGWRQFINSRRSEGAGMIMLRGSAPSDAWAQVRALGAEEPSIRFVDEYLTPAQMVTYYRAADAFISFPATDLFAVSLMEGMACGALPIVAPLPAYEAAFNELDVKGKRWNAIIATDRSIGGCADALERWWKLKPEDENVTREVNARHARADGDFIKNAEQIEEVFKMAQESFRYRMRRRG